MKNKLLSVLIFLGSYTAYSQVGIGTPLPNSSSQLEVVASDKGVLIPRINLTGSMDAVTIKNGNINSLLVFNTATVSDVKPGYYYWYNTKWNRIVISSETNSIPGTVTYNPTTNVFSYVDNTGVSQVIDIGAIIKSKETVTTLIGNPDGSYIYTNEAGTAVKIDIVGDVTTNFSTIVNNPTVTSIIEQIVDKTKGVVIFNSTTNQFSYIDNAGNPQLVDISTIIKANETVTTLVNNGGGSYTYNNESGAAVNIDVVGDVTTNFTTIANDPAVTNIIQTIVNKTAGNVTFDSTTNQFSYVDNSGNTQLVDINTIVKANETVTTLINNGGGSYTYNNESGVAVNIDVVGDVTTNFTTIANDPAVTNIIQTIVNKTAGNVTFDSTTNQFSYVDNSGNTQLVDISTIVKANETVTTLAQNTATGAITYNNETGIATIVQVKSADVGNILQVGTDGGSLLTPAAITSATTISNTSAVNTSTVTVNGVTSTGAPIVNSNATSLSGSSLTTTVNGVASTPLDLGPAITGATTVSNASAVNTSTITVNGVTSLGAPIVNSNATSLSGSSLTTTVNGVDSTPLDLAPAITAAQTLTNLAQDTTSGLITYTNENAVDQTAVVTSTNAGNILGVGTDGGSLLTPAAITSATTVTNASAVNTSTVTVNGVTSTGAPIVNSNATSLSGSSLTTTVNGVASTPLDLGPAITSATTVSNTSAVNTSTVTVNGVTSAGAPIVNSNATSLSGSSLTTSVNGVASTPLDLGPAITSATTVSNASAVNISTVTVNGVTSTGAPIVNSNATSLSGSSLTTTVNGVASTPLDLGPAITAAQTLTNLAQDPASGLITYTNENAVDQTAVVTSADIGNILGIGTDGGSLLTPAAITSATTVSNASAVNTSTVTVNGVTSTGAPIVNSNATSLSGSSLTTSVNGVDSTPLDLAPAITAAQTLTNLAQDPASGLITYTNENAVDQTAVVTSTDAGNVLGIGTDGGSLLTPAAITSATTVSNASAVNISTVTVNGVTSLGAPIVNSNATSLSGSSLTTSVNGVDSTPLDLAPAITAAQTLTNLAQDPASGLITYTNENAVDQTAVVTSTDAGNVLGIGTDGGSLLTPAAITSATTVSNASAVNTSTVTVNGVTSLGAPIVNSNATSLSGSSLTTSVNGVDSTPLDLAPAITAAQTLTNLAQDPASGLITYTNENAVDQTAVVTSTDAGNVLGIGTDGGSLLTPAAITSATTVSNASAVNTSTVTVNGVISTGAPIVNSNATSLSGSSLTTSVNGVDSTPLDLAPAITAAQTLTNLAQDPASGLITYTNENAVDQTAVVTSTDAGNVLGIGTDGGSLLTPAAITSATTVSNASAVNISTVTVNGVTSLGAPIVNSNATSLSGSSLTTSVNGVASTPLDLGPAITAAQTLTNLAQDPASGLITYTNENAVDQTAVVTSTDAGNVLGIGTDGGSLLTPAAITSATTVSNASAVNISTVTVNGVTSLGAPIVNSNATSLSGSSLTTSVNGVDSTPLDLAPAITAAQTLTNLAQDPASGLITYTNENAVDQTAVVTSTDAGNVLGIGTDGGSLLTTAAITSATTVSNASAVNTSTVTVNGVTSLGAPIVNSNTLTLSGADLTSTVNGVSSTVLDLTPAISVATTNTLTATDGNLISTVNGVATNPAVPVLITADNGLTVTNGNVQLGGVLLNPTTITTDPANTLAIQGLLYSPPFNDIVVVDPSTGVLQKTTAKELNYFNWSIEGNMGIQSSFHFLGTLDDADLIFKRNSIVAGRLEPNNTSFGVNALTDSSGGINNVAIGTFALNSNTTGQRNSALGFSAMTSNTTGSENIGAGYFSLNLNTIGGQNTAFGTSSFQNLTQGNRNTAIGYSSGMILGSGEDVTLIGAFTGSADGLSYATAIGSGAFVATSNSLVLGGANTNVGIGTDSPTNTFHVIPATGIDPLRVEGLQSGTATDNLVVVDATGVLRTVTLSSDWSLSGNAGTSLPTNFIGTLDDQSLLFKINNEQAALLSGSTFGANTSFGYLGLLNNNALGGGIYNTALGQGALTANTIGAGNTALGKNVLTNNLTGNNNIALGADAGSNLTAGNNNIIIGSNTATGVNASGPTASNELNIGNTLYGTDVNNTFGANNGKIGINTNVPTESSDVNGTTRLRKLPVNGTASAIYTKSDGSSSAAADQPFTAVNTLVVDANGVLGTIPGIALTTPPSVQTIQYSRTTTPINSGTPLNSVTSIGILSIRFNGTATTSGNYIEFRTDVSNQVTAFAEVSGSGGNYFANWRTTAAAAGTWYQATGQGVTPNNRDTYTLMITLHNSQEIYRVSLICNGNIAASSSPAIPAVPSQVILFIEKLQ